MDLRISTLTTQAARSRLERVEAIYAATDPTTLTEHERQFLQDARRATTDEAVRVRRAEFLLGLMR